MGKYALLISGVLLEDDTKDALSTCLLGYTLLLRRREGAYRRVGVAKVLLEEFGPVEQTDFHIFLDS